MITLLHPSRGRPEKAVQTAKRWIELAGTYVEHILSLDESDDWMAYKMTAIVNPNSSVVEATNRAAKLAKGDIFVYLSDDFDCFPDWALAVEKEFENRPMLIKVDDCLQKFDVPVLTIPIMNRLLYDRLGYFWHPEYRSMFVDEDLFWTARKLGAMKMCPHLKFQHNHVSVGRADDDETYRRSAANWDQGKALFKKRQGLGFPL